MAPSKHSTDEKPYVFCDLELTGHHVEFLSHLIKYRLQHLDLPPFVVVAHPDIRVQLNQLVAAQNIEARGVRLVHPTVSQLLVISQKRSQLGRAWEEFRLFIQIASVHGAERLWLMALNRYQHAVGSGRFSNGMLIRGILFNPLGAVGSRLPDWITRTRKWFRLAWMIRNRGVERVFILNDAERVEQLNGLFSTTETFAVLPDPVLNSPAPTEDKAPALPLRSTLLTRFLLFGSLSKRKGVLVLLDALLLLEPDQCAKIEVVFAGHLNGETRQAFQAKLRALRNTRPELRVTLMDRFLPYQEVSTLFMSADYVLVPYLKAESSSGVLGHAARFGKPVIGPCKGLLGQLILRYQLGTCIDAVTPVHLANALVDSATSTMSQTATRGMRRFVEERNPEMFVEILVELEA